MIELPEVHELVAWSPNPGDRLIVRNTEVELDRRQVDEITEAVRRALNLSPDFPVMVLGRDWEVSAVNPADLPTTAARH